MNVTCNPFLFLYVKIDSKNNFFKKYIYVHELQEDKKKDKRPSFCMKKLVENKKEKQQETDGRTEEIAKNRIACV